MTTFTIRFKSGEHDNEIKVDNQELCQKLVAVLMEKKATNVTYVDRDDIIICPKCNMAKGPKEDIERNCWVCNPPKIPPVEYYDAPDGRKVKAILMSDIA